MKRFLSLILATFILATSFSLVGCGASKSDSKVLRICNCEDYIDEELITKFEEEYPEIKVQYSTFGTNENLYNELVINPNSYDIVVPSEYMIEKLAEEGRLNKLVLSEVPSYQANVSQYINQRLGSVKVDVKEGKYKGEQVPLSNFMVGYMWGTMGWVYNTDYVSEEQVSSWGGVFDDKSLKEKITIKDAVRDSYLVGLAMVYKDDLINAKSTEDVTKILNRVDQKSIDRVGEKLSSLKPMLYGFEVDSGKNDIVLGNINAYVAWSGDAAYAIDVALGEVEDEDGSYVKKTVPLSYKIPDEGSNIWFDGMVMPAGSDNYDAVYKFMDFISRPENVAINMNYIGYTSLVAGDTVFNDVALDWFDDEEGFVYDVGAEFVEQLTPNELLNKLQELGFQENNDDFILAVGEEIVGEFTSVEIKSKKEELGYKVVDLSYFFGENGDYKLTVHEDDYGRLMAQYPTIETLNRCAIMQNFDNETLLSINDMWETVKGETFPVWVILLVAGIVLLLAVLIVLYRHKEKLKWFRLPERKLTAMEKKGYKAVKKENI